MSFSKIWVNSLGTFHDFFIIFMDFASISGELPLYTAICRRLTSVTWNSRLHYGGQRHPPQTGLSVFADPELSQEDALKDVHDTTRVCVLQCPLLVGQLPTKCLSPLPFSLPSTPTSNPFASKMFPHPHEKAIVVSFPAGNKNEHLCSSKTTDTVLTSKYSSICVLLVG